MLTIISFLFAITLLVAVHEFGHYWVARRCGVRVLVFSIGFGKPLLQWRRGDTVWQIAMIPLGGYVKMLGEEDAAEFAQEGAFHKQHPLKRMAIVVAGPLANFVLAWLLYAGVAMVGIDLLRPMIGSVQAQSAAERAGLQVGDEITMLGTTPIANWEDLRLAFLRQAIDVQQVALRVRTPDGIESVRQLDLSGLDRASRGDLHALSHLGLSAVPLLRKIAAVTPDGAAAKAGLQAGDVVVALNDMPVRHWGDLHQWVQARPGATVRVLFVRDGVQREAQVVLSAVEEAGRSIGRLGVSPEIDTARLAQWRQTVRLGLLDALARGASEVLDKSLLTIKLFGRMLTGAFSASQVSGPIGIAQFAGQSAALGVAAYLNFLAIISLSLGVLNLLPVPVLDGGHFLYHMAEFLRGRPLPESVQSAGQRIGLALLLGLMALAIFNDLYRLISG